MASSDIITKLILTDVRVGYVYIREPRIPKETKRKDEKGAYQIMVYLDKKKDRRLVMKIKKAVDAAAKSRFGAKYKPGMLKLPLRDGDEEREGEEYEGKLFLNANCDMNRLNARAPGIVNRANKPPTEAEFEEMGYAGCYMHVSVSVFPFEGDSAKGVAVGLNNIMLRRSGDRLDGSSNAEQDFEEYAEDEDEDENWDDTDEEEL